MPDKDVCSVLYKLAIKNLEELEQGFAPDDEFRRKETLYHTTCLLELLGDSRHKELNERRVKYLCNSIKSPERY